MRTIRAGYLGRIGYADALALQERARQELRAGTGPERLFLLEHSPVYTLGRNAQASDILAAPEWLAEQGIEVHETDRGGKVTFHGPGQLVGYPIVDLSPDRRDLRRYVRDLQEVLIRTLAHYGIAAERRDGADAIGVWVADAKIASIGVHVSRWITTHGFALNVNTDLALFGGIVACGLPDVRMTSIERLRGESVALDEVAEMVAAHFGDVFERRLEWDTAGISEPAAAATGETASGAWR